MSTADEATLAREGSLLGRYLVGREPSPALVARYVDAARTLFAPVSDEPVVAWMRRHPWSLPFLDAAAALRAPTGLLRGKVLIMAAILETSPEHADEFLPAVVSPVRLVWQLALSGTSAVLQALIGLPLWAIAARGRV
ncbi:MAG: hypothetical protein KIT14_00960 [bacterium]|nr:hypothetical protein [bacterium]